MDNALIKKKIISGGTKAVDFTDGTKVKFHFCTRKCDEEKTVIDDSKKTNTPMELILGKKFKLDVWEVAVQTMALNEIASFTVDSSLLQSYPFVSKTLRDANNPNKPTRSHCCAATLQKDGVGYDDLNMLIKNPCDLEFIIELIKVEAPDEYEKETWQMEEDEKLKRIPELKSEGNQLYNNKDYVKAADKYATAIGMLEQLMLKEKPKDKEWRELNNIKLPILLNYAQCKLMEKDYYPVIEHCTTVLEHEPNNVKALFRRGKAHLAVWNCTEAEEDFKKVAELDTTLQKMVQKELREMEETKRRKNLEDREKFKGKIF
ncbi:UNVERIFIED_CONTAM: hypothetical protein PYX00_005294 [Menopon gallinae]|uniref:AIP/AIPL N-terminal FKBP-type PPIase domain-containing protein n=1 Tax=Menopon gallinae TaxID=328185 RepID=A0AAW2HR43_9NEOP